MDITPLPHRPLGQTGLNISPLGLGTVKFGRNAGVKYPKPFEIPDEGHLSGLLMLAKSLGVNLLDTAPSYGASEERLGRLLKGQRHDWVIVGKAGEIFENEQSTYVFTPEYFEESLTQSLKRLDTDYLDVLMIHSDGNDMEILANEKLIEKMNDFKKRGLVRAVGASTKTVEGGMMALQLLDVVMASYSPGYTLEKPVLDYAAQNDKAVLLKKALASGHDADISAAMKFALSHPGTGSVIVGTINPEHLRENAQAALRALPL
jgi:aryl-alcohol dehydrogenase-like predicted oxidoreductase